MTYGERLNFARKRCGMTQTELGKRCGLSKQAISNYEQDVVGNIPLNKVKQMAEILDCNPAFICGWTDDVRTDVTRFNDEFNSLNFNGVQKVYEYIHMLYASGEYAKTTEQHKAG